MKRLATYIVSVVLVIGAALPALAAKPLTPESINGATIVGDKWVKDNHGKMSVFDVRKKAEYIDAHIPGAVSVPYREKSAKSVDFDSSEDRFKLAKFPTNKSDPVIVYCNGPRCWKSYKAAVLLVRAGHTKVYWYRNDGLPGWRTKGYPVE